MVKLNALILFVLLSGCSNVDKLIGVDDPKDTEPQLVTVACCRNADDSWPASVPQEHRDFCVAVAQANHRGVTLNGYFAASNDCGTGHLQVGDEYYKGNPL